MASTMTSFPAILSLLLLIGGGSVHVTAERKSYEGYSVIQVTARSSDDVAVLRDMMINDETTDFWSEPGGVGADVRIMVSPGHADDVTRQLRDSGMKVRYRTRNIQKKLDRMWRDIDNEDIQTRAFGDMDLNEFNTINKIYRWLNTTSAQCRPGVQCEVYSIGESYQGRPINVFKLSKPGVGRKAYWIDATIHAREWISTATAVRIIDHLSRGADANARRLVDSYDWYILPIVNPDGYSYTFTDDRLWRKNRHVNVGTSCVGVDLNRNFDVKWGTEGVSYRPCSPVYCGPRPASELETIAVQNEANRLGAALRAWLTMHSYGRMWMFPYATTVNHSPYSPCERAPDHEDLMEVANAAANAVESTYRTHWERGNSCEVIYAAAGGTDDYVKMVTGVKYSYVAELRGTSFIIDKRQIQSSFTEMWSGIVAMADAIAANED